MKKIYFSFMLICIFQINTVSVNAQTKNSVKATSTAVPANLLNFDGTNITSSKDNPARSWVMSTDLSTFKLPFSTANGQKIFSGAGNVQCDFYGGVMINTIAGSAMNTPQFLLGDATSYYKSKFAAYIDNGSLSSEINTLLMWRKDQFTNQPTGNVVFDNTDNSKISMNLLNVLDQWDSPSKCRFVIKNGTQYYISEFESQNKTGVIQLLDFGNSTVVGKRWGIFNPTADNFAIPTPLPVFSAVDFTDVQEVGVIYYAHRAQYGHSFQFDKLEFDGLVTPVSVTAVSISPKIITLQPGGTSNVTTTITPINATNQTITYSSSKPGIATVDATGLVSAIAIGTAYIRAISNDNNMKDSALVNVQGTILTCDFTGTAPVANLPWTKTTVLDSHITFSGWNLGEGMKIGRTDNSWNGPIVDNALGLSIIAKNNPNSLQDAIDDKQYVTFTLTPKLGSKLNLNSSVVNFKVKLVSGNGALQYSIFSGITGFAAGNVIYTTPAIDQWSTNEQPITFTFPATGYDNMTNPLELRVYLHNAKYAYHTTTITSWTMTGTYSDVATNLSTDHLSTLNVYPNPVMNHLSLNFGQLVEKADLTILNLQGQTIIHKNIANIQIENIDVSHLNSGVYLIRIKEGDKISNTKFVKR